MCCEQTENLEPLGAALAHNVNERLRRPISLTSLTRGRELLSYMPPPAAATPDVRPNSETPATVC